MTAAIDCFALGPRNSSWVLRGTLSGTLRGNPSSATAVAGPEGCCTGRRMLLPKPNCILSSCVVSWGNLVHCCLRAFAGAATTALPSDRPATSARRPSPAAVAAAAAEVVAAVDTIAGGATAATRAVGATTMAAVAVAASALARLCAVTIGAAATTGVDGITTAVGGTDVPVARAKGTLGPLAMPPRVARLHSLGGVAQAGQGGEGGTLLVVGVRACCGLEPCSYVGACAPLSV